MAFDGITLKKVIDELQILIDARVDKITEPSNSNIIINVYKQKNYFINIDISANNYGMYLTNHKKINPLEAPNFCMVLRKYLENAKIKKIYMQGLERICFIEFEVYNRIHELIPRTLAIELMGKYSNIVLYNENNIIIDALKKFNGNEIGREIFPAREYILPEQTKIEITNTKEEEFEKIVSNDENKVLEKSIPNKFIGISKLFIQSAIEELHLSNTISSKSLKEIYNYIFEILNNQNAVFKSFKKSYSVFLSNEKESLQNNYFLDDFYYNKVNEETYINYRNMVLKIINGTLDKLLKKMDNINEKIKSCDDMEKYKIYGELLIANIYKFDNTKNLEKVTVENYYDNNNLIEIPIEKNLSISKNSEKYFKKYNKLKNTLQIVKVQKKETEKELNYLESLIQEMDNCTTFEDIDEVYNEISESILFNTDIKNKKSKKKSDKNDSMVNNYIRLKVDDYDVLVGKNNKQNDYLTLRVANKNDIWFHTKDIHGSHLILRCNGETPKMETIIKCAKICAYYSKAKFSSHVPVDYTFVKNVHKPHGANPGFVIYTNNKTVYVDPSIEFINVTS